MLGNEKEFAVSLAFRLIANTSRLEVTFVIMETLFFAIGLSKYLSSESQFHEFR